ncbi:hypothetical protein Lser_V15G43643 [Lactuca serriola]
MNPPPRLNKHIRFSTTSSSSSSADDTEHHGSTRPIGDTTKPMIQDDSPYTITYYYCCSSLGLCEEEEEGRLQEKVADPRTTSSSLHFLMSTPNAASSNFNDWIQNIWMVTRYEDKEYVLDKEIKEVDKATATPEEIFEYRAHEKDTTKKEFCDLFCLYNKTFSLAENLFLEGRIPKKMPINAGSEQPPSPMAAQNDSSSVATNGGGNSFGQAKSPVFTTKAFQKLEDDIKLVGKNILYHEENIKYLNKVRGSFAHNIADMEVTLAKYQSSSDDMTKCNVLSRKRSLEETVESIMQHEKSAASVLCHLTRNVSKMSSARNVIGVLATLGHVDNINLSRLLSEYLGLDTMLAIVCKSYQAVRCLETYDQEGSIKKTTGLYRLGACHGKSIDGRFNVICLQGLIPYVGEFMPDDPQRRLVILEPKLPNGESPAGFLGFAVNMIYIDNENLAFVTDNGYGLRETLFYSLFSRLQVYRTRNDMLQALPLISHGAISLDGGIIKSRSVLILGTPKEIGVRFGIWSGDSFPSKDYTETEKEMKELKWKSDKINDDIRREQDLLANEKSKFEVKKKEFLDFISQRLIDPMQHPVQATHEGATTPKHGLSKTIVEID